MNRELPRRKHIRLKEYDYRLPGIYFVTTNVRGNRCLLSHVQVGRGLAPAEVRLTELGRIVEEELRDLPRRYPGVTVHKYVIMPNHVHMVLGWETAGASPRPTLMQVVGAFKSLAARRCNRLRNTPGEAFWQTSFYESVISSEKVYRDVWQYIEENPVRWAEDPYYTDT